MANLKDVIYISNEDYDILVSTGTVTIDGDTLTYDENNVYVTPDKLASTTEDGLMSSADKVKLDDIEAGAQVNPSEYLKSASVSSNTLTVIKQNNESVVYTPSFTDTNQTVKGNGTSFGSNDAVDIVGTGAVTVTGDATNKKITINAPSVTDTNQTVKANNVTFGANDVVEIKAGSNVTVTGDSSEKTITISSTDNNTTYTFAEGTTNKAFTVTPSGGSAQTVSIHGLGDASLKGVTTSSTGISSSSTDDTLATAKAVYNAIDALPEPMIFKGTLGTNGTITSLPTASSSNEGYTYKVITAGTYASIVAKVGDVFVCAKTGTSTYEWVLIPAGDDIEDTWRQINVNGTQLLGTGISTGAVNFKNGSNVTITGSGNDITIASSYTDTNQTVKGNGTAFGANDAVDIKGSGIVTVTGNANDKEITISASHQSIKSLDTTATTAQTTSSSEAIAGSGTITLHKVSKTGSYNDLLNKPTIPTVDTAISTTSTNAVQNKAISLYIASRGENLLTNGTCLLGNNYNFPDFSFDGSDTYYAGGCFKHVGTRMVTSTTEFMPVDVNQTYEISYYAKSSSSTSTIYDFLNMFDIDKKSITAEHIMWISGSTTTLAQELKNGDTKVYLTSVAGFNKTTTATYQRGLIFWNYTNSFGYTYGTETYSRNVFTNKWAGESSFDTTNNTITLSSAWTGGTFPAGTSVSQSNSGSTFSYMTTGPAGTTNWFQRKATMSGVGKNNASGKFREGTAFVQLGWIIDQNSEANVTWKLSTLSVAKYIPSLSNTMTTNTAQTVSGVKTLSNNVFLKAYNTSSGQRNLIGMNSSNNVIVGDSSNDMSLFAYSTVNPRSTGTLSLGSTNNKWNDIWLSGSLKDGTNSISVAGIVAKQDALPTTTTAGKVLKSTSTAGTVEWGDASTTDNNQTVKTSSVTFGANDAVQITAGSNVTVTGDATSKTITIAGTADTGATSVETIGSGNVVNSASYDASTRKLTLSKGVTALTSHQSIKTLKTDNTTAQSTSSSEAIAGSGTINLHKVAKTGTYSDLIGTPTIPATNVIPTTINSGYFLIATSTAGTAEWSTISFQQSNATTGEVGILTNGHFTAYGDDDENFAYKPTDETGFSGDLDTYYCNTGITAYSNDDDDYYSYSFPDNSGTLALREDICNSSIAYCDVPASTAAKTATMPGFITLTSDTRILLRITTTNTATSNVTLNVNSTGAKTIKVEGSTITSSSTAALLTAGDYIAYYDGAYWNLTNITGIFNLINLSSVVGAGTSPSGLLSTKWYSSSGAGGFTLPFNGMRILVKIPTLGTNNTTVTTPTQDTIPGALLSINANNNTYYYPVLDSDGKKITGQFPVDSYKIFVFNSSKVATGYKTAGTQTSITGCWIAEADNKLDAYPVGAIYITNTSTSPASLFGGTWEQIKGRFLFSAGANSANSITTYGDLAANQINLGGTGSTGGEIFHQLGVTEMPSHQHEVIEALDNTNIKLGNYSGSDRRSISNTLNAPSWGNNITTSSVGGSLGHNNMPPFYTCYMWKRTA